MFGGMFGRGGHGPVTPIPDQFCWSRGGDLGRVIDQGYTETCSTHSTLGCLHSYFVIHFKLDHRGSTQEVLDRMPYKLEDPIENIINIDKEIGIPVHPRDVLRFILVNGVCFDSSYPLIVGLEGCAMNNILDSKTFSTPPPELKIYLKGYSWVYIYDRLCYGDICRSILPNTIIGGMRVLRESFEPWNILGEGVYRENEDQRAMVQAACRNEVTKRIMVSHHAVEIFGFEPSYFIIKNTYSNTWGEKGFGRIGKECFLEFGWPTGYAKEKLKMVDYWIEKKQKFVDAIEAYNVSTSGGPTPMDE